MAGVLLDTHALYWLVSGTKALTDETLVAIGESKAIDRLFVSPITAWELSIAARKPSHEDPPRLDTAIAQWFGEALRATSAKIVPIQLKIAIEAAEVPLVTGHRDPGDCSLIATARVRRIPLVTHDPIIRRLADEGYLDVVVC